ncbi:MAG: SDR family oxidoreductase [Leptospirales bacterium]
MTRVLVTGSSGMLGSNVMKALADKEYEVLAADRSRFDLEDPLGAYQYVLSIKPHAIIHLAAETDVDLCERDPKRAGIRNHLATEMIASAARECMSWILYVSTSNIFGSEGKSIFNELDLPNPINYYGRSKLFGEYAIRTHCPSSHLIIRAGWMFGGGPQRDFKFVGKIIRQIEEGAPFLKAVSDRSGTLTYAKFLGDFIGWSLERGQTGTLHYCSKGSVTRLEIARAIADFFSFKGAIESVSSAQFPLSAPRPLSDGIESIYLSMLEDAPKSGFWKDDLEEYLSTFKKEAPQKNL